MERSMMNNEKIRSNSSSTTTKSLLEAQIEEADDIARTVKRLREEKEKARRQRELPQVGGGDSGGGGSIVDKQHSTNRQLWPSSSGHSSGHSDTSSNRGTRRTPSASPVEAGERKQILLGGSSSNWTILSPPSMMSSMNSSFATAVQGDEMDMIGDPIGDSDGGGKGLISLKLLTERCTRMEAQQEALKRNHKRVCSERNDLLQLCKEQQTVMEDLKDDQEQWKAAREKEWQEMTQELDFLRTKIEAQIVLSVAPADGENGDEEDVEQGNRKGREGGGGGEDDESEAFETAKNESNTTSNPINENKNEGKGREGVHAVLREVDSSTIQSLQEKLKARDAAATTFQTGLSELEAQQNDRATQYGDKLREKEAL